MRLLSVFIGAHILFNSGRWYIEQSKYYTGFFIMNVTFKQLITRSELIACA